MLINDFRVMRDIEERLQEAINNPEKLDIHGTRLKPVGRGEKVIDTVQSTLLRALYVVLMESMAHSRLEIAQSALEMNEIDRQERRHKGHYLDDLNDVCGYIFWTELKLEIRFNHSEGMNIDVREGWKIVSFRERSQIAEGFRAILGGPPEQ